MSDGLYEADDYGNIWRDSIGRDDEPEQALVVSIGPTVFARAVAEELNRAFQQGKEEALKACDELAREFDGQRATAHDRSGALLCAKAGRA